MTTEDARQVRNDPARADPAQAVPDSDRRDDLNGVGPPEPPASTAHNSEAHSDQGFAALVQRHGGRMLAVARRIVGDEADAADCVQDAFLHAYKGANGFAGRSSVGTWLHRIVVNEALQRLRRRKSFREEPLEAASALFDAEGCRIDDRAQSLRLAEAVFESRQHRALVRRTIAGLPTGHRTILILRDIEGYDTAETASLLDLSPTATKVRLHRARLALKSALLAELEDPPL